jgi:glycosyltransferase involved in cell wall biosynthesis
MKRVLFVAYYFPPIAASGAMRPLGFCRHLGAYGWSPTVLSTTTESVYPPHPVDHQLEAHVPADVAVERVGYRDSLSRLIDIRDRVRSSLFGRPAALNGKGVRGEPGGTAALIEQRPRSALKEAILDWMFAFPDRSASWIAPAVARIMSMNEQRRPDIVIATGGPWTNFVVGRMLASRLGCPLIIDYRDPWTCNPYYSFSAQFLTEKACRLEKAICKSASRVITNTEELKARLCVEYPEIEHKCIAISNGFDAEILGIEEAKANYPVAQQRPTAGYELCHFGTVYGKRTPVKLLQALSELYQAGAVKPQQLRLRFVGAWESTDDACNRLAQDLEKQGLLRRESPMSHQLCVGQMKQASVLLVVQPESPLQVPGKIYEYIAVGRPLLLVGGEGATAGLVRRHNLGLTCPNEVTELKHILLRLVSGSLVLSQPERQAVDQFSYRRLANSLADTLNAVQREAASSHCGNVVHRA